MENSCIPRMFKRKKKDMHECGGENILYTSVLNTLEQNDKDYTGSQNCDIGVLHLFVTSLVMEVFSPGIFFFLLLCSKRELRY
jgi:hypothetical protein